MSLPLTVGSDSRSPTHSKTANEWGTRGIPGLVKNHPEAKQAGEIPLGAKQRQGASQIRYHFGGAYFQGKLCSHAVGRAA